MRYAVAFSQRMPPVQNIATLGRFLTIQPRNEIAFDPRGQLAERRRLRVHRTFECADRHFVVVARVDHDYIRVRDQRIPITGRNVGPDNRVGIDGRHTHRHDLALDAHFHPAERLFLGERFLPRDVLAAWNLTDRGKQ